MIMNTYHALRNLQHGFMNLARALREEHITEQDALLNALEILDNHRAFLISRLNPDGLPIEDLIRYGFAKPCGGKGKR